MATNLKIDDKLLNEVLHLGQFKSKREAVNQALADFIQHHRQAEILRWEGKVDFFEDYDHKKLRKAR